MRTPPQGWAAEALCAQTDPDLFYPEAGDSAGAPAQARGVCQACPVRLPCLEHALNRHESHGIWGGMTPRQRLRILRDRARQAPPMEGTAA